MSQSMSADASAVGREMYEMIRELYPICRSITGDGVRETLRRVQERIPLAIREVPSGTQVFDWTVPREWNIRDAYVKNSRGEKIIDFTRSNLHVVSYSVPVRTTLPLSGLRGHLFSLPERPAWIPFRTSYYTEAWGFCLAHDQLSALGEDEYEVVIDSSLAPGHLSYGEYLIEGERSEEVLLSCHVCHPSLANDNLSGIAVATALAQRLRAMPLTYSYRFLFIPGTIGSITWLALNEAIIPRIRHGLVITCVGDGGKLTYKKSRRGDAEIDRAAIHVLKHAGGPYEVTDFVPYGYDERQYCSPGFNLPVGSLSRSSYGRYPEYHTSADDLAFVRPESLADSLAKYLAILDVVDNNRTYVSRNPKGEPQLGKRGLYRHLGGQSGNPEMPLLWVLNLSDGRHTLLDIAERANVPFASVRQAADILVKHDLLERCAGDAGAAAVI